MRVFIFTGSHCCYIFYTIIKFSGIKTFIIVIALGVVLAGLFIYTTWFTTLTGFKILAVISIALVAIIFSIKKLIIPCMALSQFCFFIVLTIPVIYLPMLVNRITWSFYSSYNSFNLIHFLSLPLSLALLMADAYVLQKNYDKPK